MQVKNECDKRSLFNFKSSMIECSQKMSIPIIKEVTGSSESGGWGGGEIKRKETFFSRRVERGVVKPFMGKGWAFSGTVTF